MEYGSRKISYINVTLIAINAIYFLYLEFAGSSEDAYFMFTKGAILAPAVLEDKEYYRLLTAAFMHFGIDHIVNNMLVLFLLGDNLERALGHGKYLIFYLLCGIGSNFVSVVLEDPEAMVVSAGASGAVFGVIGGLLYAIVVNKGRLEDLSARQLVIMIGLSLYMGFTSQGVNNTAHIAGAAFGVLLCAILYRKPKKKMEESSYEAR